MASSAPSVSSDPRKQDKWTTWVEYLNYIYWEVERYAAAMRSAEPRYRRAMEELLLGGEEIIGTSKGTQQQQLRVATEVIRKQRARLTKIRQGAEDYLMYEALFHRGQGRTEWVLEELALIEKGDVEDEPAVVDSEEEAKAASMKVSSTMANVSINGGFASSRLLRKRKTRHDEDEERGKGADNSVGDVEAAPSPLKRSRTRGGSIFASSAPTVSMAEAIPEVEASSQPARSRR